MINDVSGLRHDAALAVVAAKYKTPSILVHMRGVPRTMQRTAFARDAMKDVLRGLRKSMQVALRAGVAKSQIILDPGIGFGKSFAQNYELLRKLPQLTALGCPLLVGTSRKGFLGKTLSRDGNTAPPEDRIWDGRDGYGQHPRRSAYCACSRCGGDGENRQGRGLHSPAKTPVLKSAKFALDLTGAAIWKVAPEQRRVRWRYPAECIPRRN